MPLEMSLSKIWLTNFVSEIVWIKPRLIAESCGFSKCRHCWVFLPFWCLRVPLLPFLGDPVSYIQDFNESYASVNVPVVSSGET